MNRKRGLLAFSLIVCILVAVLTVACSFSINNSVFAGNTPVKVEVAAGVFQDAAGEIRQAADATAGFFSDTAGLQLNRPVTIVLAPDRKSFISEAMRVFKVSETEAMRAGQGTDALAGDGLIVINMAGVPTSRQKIFLVAHEMTHQYQRQLAGRQAGEVKWLLEGMAETVGAQVVARRGYMTLEDYKNNWWTGLEHTVSRPNLSEMKTAEGWSAALSRYGSPVTYKTAGLAVLILTERYGQQSVLNYFTLLGQGESSDESFQKAFGLSMADFIAEYSRMLRKAA